MILWTSVFPNTGFLHAHKKKIAKNFTLLAPLHLESFPNILCYYHMGNFESLPCSRVSNTFLAKIYALVLHSVLQNSESLVFLFPCKASQCSAFVFSRPSLFWALLGGSPPTNSDVTEFGILKILNFLLRFLCL